MNIREQLSILASVGQWDLKRRDLLEKRKLLPKKAEDADAFYLDLKKKHDALVAKIEVSQHERRGANDKLEVEKGNVRKWESRAEKIRGDREYTALMSEIGSLKRVISDLEAKINTHQQEVRDTEKLLEPLKVNLEAAKGRAEHEAEQIKQELAEIDAEVSSLDDVRGKLLAQLPPVLFKKYDLIAQRRAGQAVAVIKNEVCQSCMRMVPPEMHLRIRKAEIIEQCPSCQRILVPEGINDVEGTQA